MIRMEAANRAVMDAQVALTKVTAEYDALLKPVDDKLSAIDEAQTRLTEDQKKSRLQLILADPNASASAKRQAALELERVDAERAQRALLAEKKTAVDVAQGALDVALEARSTAEADLSAKRSLLEAQAEHNNLLREQANLLAGITTGVVALADAVAVKLGGALGGIAGQVAKLGQKAFTPDTSWIEKWQILINAKLTQVRAAWAAAWAEFEEKMQPVKDFIEQEVNPLLTKLWLILQGQGTMAIATLTRIWNDKLLPDLKELWRWIDTYVNPELERMWGYFETLLPVAVLIVSSAINTVLIPALEGVYGVLTDLVLPALGHMYRYFFVRLPVAMEKFADALVKLGGAIGKLVDESINVATNALDNLLKAAAGLHDYLRGKIFEFVVKIPELPWWLIPGSPTPLELGLHGIVKGLREFNSVAGATLPNLVRQSNLNLVPNMAWGGGHTTNHQTTNAQQFFYQPQYQAPARGPEGDSALMRALWSGY
jgi:hypothetical protein